MIITTWNGKSFDTNKDLTQFREKKKDSLLKGWNNLGPVTESTALRAIIQDIERKVATRLKTEQD